MADEKINDKELEQISGGYDPYGGVPTNGGSAPNYIGDPVNLVGAYYVSSFAEGKAYYPPRSWEGRVFYAANAYPGRPAGYRVREANGTDVGWAPRGSLYFL